MQLSNKTGGRSDVIPEFGERMEEGMRKFKGDNKGGGGKGINTKHTCSERVHPTSPPRKHRIQLLWRKEKGAKDPAREPGYEKTRKGMRKVIIMLLIG